MFKDYFKIPYILICIQYLVSFQISLTKYWNISLWSYQFEGNAPLLAMLSEPLYPPTPPPMISKSNILFSGGYSRRAIINARINVSSGFHIDTVLLSFPVLTFVRTYAVQKLQGPCLLLKKKYKIKAAPRYDVNRYSEDIIQWKLENMKHRQRFLSTQADVGFVSGHKQAAESNKDYQGLQTRTHHNNTTDTSLTSELKYFCHEFSLQVSVLLVSCHLVPAGYKLCLCWS